ncbi:LAFA_0C08284g1_1 [Lachancea sp. 'fantastica']|nr:LAFA_0C08284g1_1 [Lachancea sp. 'fantastica']
MHDATLIDIFPDESLVSYCVSPGNVFLLLLYITVERPLRVLLRVKNLKSDLKVTTYEIPIETMSSLVPKNSFGLQLAQVSKQTKNKIEFEHYIIVSTGEGLHFFTLAELFSTDKFRPRKWHLGSSADTLTSFNAYNVRGNDLQVVYATKLGSIVRFNFNIESKTFKMVSDYKDAGTDCITSCQPCEPAHIDDERIQIPELVFSSFDNYLYSLEDKLQKFPVDLASDKNVLVSAYGVVAKQYSKKALRYYVANVLNGGCCLFKRSASDTWDRIHVFERETPGVGESSPLINCVVTVQGRTQLQIASGSESGKIFFWCYNYRDDIVTESHVINVAGDQDIVHSIQILGSSVYYMVNRDSVGSSLIP